MIVSSCNTKHTLAKLFYHISPTLWWLRSFWPTLRWFCGSGVSLGGFRCCTSSLRGLCGCFRRFCSAFWRFCCPFLRFWGCLFWILCGFWRFGSLIGATIALMTGFSAIPLSITFALCVRKRTGIRTSCVKRILNHQGNYYPNQWRKIYINGLKKLSKKQVSLTSTSLCSLFCCRFSCLYHLSLCIIMYWLLK